MGFIVEITSRSGRVMERYRFDKTTASIGRGFDNDVIVHDPYVDAHHLRIENDLNGLAVESLTADGHTVIAKSKRTEPSRTPIASGAEVVIGKTHLRVFSTLHKVAPVLTFERIDRLFTALATPVGVALVTLGYLLFDYANRSLSSFAEIQWAVEARAMLAPLLAALVWAAFWALISRISRGEPRFFHHWIAVLMALALRAVLDRLLEVIAFNVGNVGVNEMLSFVTTGFVMAFALVLNLRFAFRQRTWVRHSCAYGMSVAFVAYIMVNAMSFEREFRPYPEFDSTLMPTAFLWRNNVSESEFLDNVDGLFEFPADELQTDDDPTESASQENSRPTGEVENIR